MSVSIKIWFRRIQLRLGKRPQFIKVAFLGYLFLLVVFSIRGDRGLSTSYRLWKQVEKLDSEIVELKGEVSRYRQEVKDFRSDLRTIERFAREELHLAGDREIHYIFR